MDEPADTFGGLIGEKSSNEVNDELEEQFRLQHDRNHGADRASCKGGKSGLERTTVAEGREPTGSEALDDAAPFHSWEPPLAL